MTSMHVICNLAHPQSKTLATAYGENGYLPPVTVTSDVILSIGQFYVGLFFGLELVPIMTKVGAKFRL